MADERKKLLLNLISEVKARLEGKVESVAFPIPQFIVIGKQSVGKSRLIEALAGEPFNFVSGTLGSRRPTQLEFRNVPGLSPSKWSIRQDNGTWTVHPINEVMRIVGEAHETLGNNVTDIPIRVKVEGADCVDLGLVDLPGFRSYAKDEGARTLQQKIDRLVTKFMGDENNVMIVVEEAGDAAGFATLAKAREMDRSYRRTILVRNKLDKYYNDLQNENINKWLDGFGDLPKELNRFALSLPHWSGDMPCPFGQMRTECSEQDVKVLMDDKGASEMYRKQIGFDHFREFMEVKTQELFAAALSPLLSKFRTLKDEHDKTLEIIKEESFTIDEDNILHATRSAGITFAQAFNFVMEGALSSKANRFFMENELQAFHAWCDKYEHDPSHENHLKADERKAADYALDDYIHYLRDKVELAGMDIEINGGAQFRRLMLEAEVFTRFAGISKGVAMKDILDARGHGIRGATPWGDVITKLLLMDAPSKMKGKSKYVGHRLKWFFFQQKDATLEFMLNLEGSPAEHMFSKLITKQAQVIERNGTMKQCIYQAFDAACQKHHRNFMQLWNEWLDSMFQSPLKLLRATTTPKINEDINFEDIQAPTFEATKERIMTERTSRSGAGNMINQKIKAIPDDDMAQEQTKMCQEVVQQTFSFIRCVVADQMQLYSESFFLMPMLRRLEGEMAEIQLQDDDKMTLRARKGVLDKEKKKSEGIVTDLQWAIDEIQKFKVTCSQDI